MGVCFFHYHYPILFVSPLFVCPCIPCETIVHDDQREEWSMIKTTKISMEENCCTHGGSGYCSIVSSVCVKGKYTDDRGDFMVHTQQGFA